MHTPLNPPTKEHGLHSEYQVHNTEFKMPTRKEKESLLKRYAKKLGLNDRGCYLAVGLSVLTFLLLLVIIVMAACWPGNTNTTFRNVVIVYTGYLSYPTSSIAKKLTCQKLNLNNVF